MPSLLFIPLGVVVITTLLVIVSFSSSSKESFSLAEESSLYFPTTHQKERLLAAAADNVSTSEPQQQQQVLLVLAPRKTYRKDPLDGFKRYTGGWNISNRHYWASVGYTAVPLFAISIIWFTSFGLCLSIICICYCCSLTPRAPYGYSRIAYSLSLIFLTLFAVVAMYCTCTTIPSYSIGCVVLYVGQGKYHTSTTNTMEYVVHQADGISDNLRNVSEYLSAAKQINMIGQVSLPPNIQTDIDLIHTNVDSSARSLADKTDHNSKEIKNLIESVRLTLIILSAAMLILTFIGFACSIFGMQTPVYVLVITGWILVTGTFILCGIFLLLHNVTGDTCVAMNQWVQNPTARTALDDILPCVDKTTAQDTLNRSKEVTSQLVDLINTVISNASNINFAPNFKPLYYNQSGPLLPSLCNPFNPDLADRTCTPGEVDLNNATQVWSGYVCQTSPDGICVTTGRLNPTIYGQMSDAVNLSYGLYQYGPFLVELEDCTFVQQAFMNIEAVYCPGLRKYSQHVYVGLLMVATAVMLSLVFWVIYGRERRHRAYTKEHKPRSDEGLQGEKRPTHMEK
ncbi:hypothetical protein OROHE_019985 [Orobanche hederae]